MKFEKIGPNKIKITIPHEDLSQWGVTIDSFISNSTHIDNMFLNLIDRAEFEADFVVDEGQLLVEAVPLKNDGVVLFFTKIEEFKPDNFDRVVKRQRRPRMKTRLPETDPIISLFSFKSFDDVCALANVWRLDQPNTLYEYRGVYYLAISSNDWFVDSKQRIFIYEYARSVRASQIHEAFLREHANVVAEGNALGVVDVYFNS